MNQECIAVVVCKSYDPIRRPDEWSWLCTLLMLSRLGAVTMQWYSRVYAWLHGQSEIQAFGSIRPAIRRDSLSSSPGRMRWDVFFTFSKWLDCAAVRTTAVWRANLGEVALVWTLGGFDSKPNFEQSTTKINVNGDILNMLSESITDCLRTASSQNRSVSKFLRLNLGFLEF